MNIYAQVEYNYRAPVISTQPASGGYYSNVPTTVTELYGEAYICLYDAATRQPVNGNYCVVTYQDNPDGQFGPVLQVVIPGQSARTKVGLLQRTGGTNPYHYAVSILSITEAESLPVTPPPPACDAVINTVTINQPESDYGTADGKITIEASSGFLPLKYSIDGVNWQAAAIFSNLPGGGYTACIADANGCTATSSFYIPANHSLLVADPSVDLGGGNICRWNAAFNPVVFTYQRKDASLMRLEPHAKGTLLTIDASIGSLTTDDYIYICTNACKGTYQVQQVMADQNQVVIGLPYQPGMAGQSGFVNSNRLRPYYKIYTRITYQDKLTGQQQSIISTNRPNSSGLVKADLSSFLQSLLRARDESTFTELNYRDDNLSASYTIAYAESWDSSPNEDEATRTYHLIEKPYYVIYAAKQLGDIYGGSMAAYVPFSNLYNAKPPVRWLTDFAEPACSAGYPFDIGFIYSEDMAGLEVFCEVVQLDINRQPLPGGPQTTFLLNEDHSFLLNAEGGRYIISRQTVGNLPLAQHIGLNRLRLNGSYDPTTAYLNLTLKYANENGIHNLTQTQTIRIDDAVDDQSVYLRWIGLSGSWNYYRFVYNQEINLDVQNATIIKRYVSDWQHQDSQEEVISKSAGLKMKVMAEDLSVNDIKGLQALKYSPKVQLLLNRSPVQWQTVVLNTATFMEYETRNRQAPFSVTFNLPGINIQTQ